MDDDAITIQPATASDIALIAEQERDVYSTEDAVPASTLHDWFATNNSGFNSVHYNSSIIGHFNLLPFKPAFLAQLSIGAVAERDAKASDLYAISQRHLVKDIYVESIAVLHRAPVIRGLALRQLFDSFEAMVERVCSVRQVQFIYALAATENGASLLRTLGFKALPAPPHRKDHHSLYQISYVDLADNLVVM